ncbi:MAG: alpha/beta hydrolase [Bacteroidota bacterium]
MRQELVSYYFKGLVLLALLALVQACSKDEGPTPTTTTTTPLSGTRYLDSIFTSIMESKEVKYGANVNQAGVAIDLLMNIYEPANDTETNRPLIILAHGGGFAEGSKEDFDQLAKSYAHSGYVAATIGYRLMTDPGGQSLKLAVVDAVQDMKAAVRYFTIDGKHSINPNNIFVGGFSAGAVMGLHYAYFDDEEIAMVPMEMQNHIASTGGLSGNSGNPGASEAIKGVINISGGLFRANWVDAGDPILYSIHGSLDNCTIDPDSPGNPDGDFIEGSCLIHPLLDSLGIINQFRKIEGGDHGVYFTCSDCNAEMRKFIFDNL